MHTIAIVGRTTLGSNQVRNKNIKLSWRVFFFYPTTAKPKGRVIILTVCIYVCSSVELKLVIRFRWVRCQSIRYHDPGNIGYVLTDFINARSRFYLVNSDFNWFHSFFTSITRLPLSNERIVFGQNFSCRVFTCFICFEFLWVQKCEFSKLVWAYVCVCVHVCDCKVAVYISKTNKDRNTKLYKQY